ncbi:cache domain-containing sensor histidine kinase [Paenibacillus sp. 1P07SE]|uniref:cache domain-containing sensor histidine kinase n=1 Tax=Paenibacillus sp. 1P07SE TaxID=3132209 RepID=UPI0039A56CCE
MIRHWRKLSFQSKLLLLFFMLGVIPSVCIGTIAYQRSVSMLEDRVLANFEVIADQLNEAIEREVEDVDQFSTFPYFTPEIFRILNQSYLPREEWGYQEIDTQQQFARLLTTYPSIFSTIQGIVLYSSTGNIYGYQVSDRSSINDKVDPRQENWYAETLRRDGGISFSGLRRETQFNSPSFLTITASRVLLDENFKKIGVMAVHITPDFIQKLVRSFKLDNMLVIVEDQYGQIIYANQPDEAEAMHQTIRPSAESSPQSGQITKQTTDHKTDGITGVYVRSDYLGWTSYLVMDREELLQDVNAIRDFTILLIFIVAAAAGIASFLLARGLSQPIRALIDSMREVERGMFKIPETAENSGEMGHLQYSYNRMVHRLDDLVQSIEEKERQKREAELYALRARITPHFLYNTINSIRMLAMLQQSQQIEKLLKALNMLIRANIKLDRELVPLDSELELLRNYAHLMELRYTDRFEVTWDVREDTLQAAVPPMILQPIMENAIFHGSLQKDGKIRIHVSARREGNELLIGISDDGQGILPEILDRINGVAPSGKTAGGDTDYANIGIANVRDRIQLRFGHPFTLHIDSRVNVGTSATYRLPYLMSALPSMNGEEEL